MIGFLFIVFSFILSRPFTAKFKFTDGMSWFLLFDDVAAVLYESSSSFFSRVSSYLKNY